MGLFDFFKTADINAGVSQYRSTPNALLLDVRTPEEYRSGHIPGSHNLPLGQLEQVLTLVKNKQTPLFVHCQSGVRSRRAVATLQQLGYTQVKNIGGISGYRGKVETV